MDFLKDLLEDKSATMISSLLGKAGFSAGQAEAFVPPAARSVLDAVKSRAGQAGLAELASNPEAVAGAVDIAGLADEAGISREKAASGLEAVLPIILGVLRDKAGSLGSLGSLLGGGGEAVGAISGMAGKLFGK